MEREGNAAKKQSNMYADRVRRSKPAWMFGPLTCLQVPLRQILPQPGKSHFVGRPRAYRSSTSARFADYFKGSVFKEKTVSFPAYLIRFTKSIFYSLRSNSYCSTKSLANVNGSKNRWIYHQKRE